MFVLILVDWCYSLFVVFRLTELLLFAGVGFVLRFVLWV